MIQTTPNFPKANPPELIQANADPKILVMWPHGDEELGARIGEHIYNERPDLLQHVDYMCGNPKAAAQEPSVRYIESDLNRSFNPKGEPTTYEEKRAQQILDQIDRGGYGFVLDVHTSRSDVDGFLLANRRNRAVDTMIACSPVKRIVMMPDKIANVALIGQVENSVSIEYARNYPQDQALTECISMIDDLVAGRPSQSPTEREFYFVTDTIPKGSGLGEAANFAMSEAGFYPVLYGGAKGVRGTYETDPSKDYSGFAATSMQTEWL